MSKLKITTDAFDYEAKLVSVGDSEMSSSQCHCAMSTLLHRVASFKNLVIKMLDLLTIFRGIEKDDDMLPTKDLFCTRYLWISTSSFPAFFWTSLCKYYDVEDSKCVKYNISHTKNDHCNHRVMIFLYNLQTLTHNHVSQRVKRIADLNIENGGYLDENALIDVANLNTENIHLLIRNYNKLSLGQNQLISTVNSILSENKLDINKDELLNTVSDLVFCSKITGAEENNKRQFQRLEQQVVLSLYSLNKMITSSVTLLKGTALSSFGTPHCLLQNGEIGCSRNQPDVSVEKTGLTYEYHLEKVITLDALKFACVPTDHGLSKKDGHFLLQQSSDQKFELFSDSTLLVHEGENDYKTNFNQNLSHILKIGNCYFNSANQHILLACEKKATLSLVNGTLLDLEAYQMATINFSSFPVILNALHLHLHSLVKSIESKEYQQLYVDQKNHRMVSRQGLPVLIARHKELKLLEEETHPLIEIMRKNYSSLTFFSVSVGVFGIIGLTILFCCCYRFKTQVWSGLKYIWTCCLTDGKPDMKDNPPLDGSAQPFVENPPEAVSRPAPMAVEYNRTLPSALSY